MNIQEKIQKLWCASVEVEGIAASMMMRKADQRYIDRCLPFLQTKIDHIKTLADSLSESGNGTEPDEVINREILNESKDIAAPDEAYKETEIKEHVPDVENETVVEPEPTQQAEETEISEEIDNAKEINEVEGSNNVENLNEVDSTPEMSISVTEAEESVIEQPDKEPESETIEQTDKDSEIINWDESETAKEIEIAHSVEFEEEQDADITDDASHIEEPNISPEPEKKSEPGPTTPDAVISLDEKLTRKLSKNFRQAISLNDKFRFRRELFGNSSQQYDAALDLIAEMSSFEEARDYFLDNYGWDAENPDVKSFFAILSNHYSN